MSTTEPTPVAVDWLGEWDRHIEQGQRAAYMQSEIERIEALGVPLLYAVLSLPLQDQQDLGVSELRQRSYMPTLRLREGYVAIAKDPDGRDMPPAQRGKVLRCKVGVRGQMDRAELQSRTHETARYTGPARQSMQRSPGGLYRTLDLTHAPRPVPIDDAIVILRQWGVGITPKRHYKARSATPLDRWAVEEVPQVQVEAPAPPAEKGRRAA